MLSRFRAFNEHPQVWNFLIGILAAAGIIALWLDHAPCYTIVGANPQPNPAEPGAYIDMGYTIRSTGEHCGGQFYRVMIDERGFKWTSPRAEITFGNFPAGDHETHSVVAYPLPVSKTKTVKIYSVMEQSKRGNPFQLLWPVTYIGPQYEIAIIQK